MQVTIYSNQTEQILTLPHPMLLSEALAGRGLPIEMPCGGRQRCLKCRVIATGELSPPSERELSLLTPDEIAKGVWFACMTTLLGDAQVRLSGGDRREHIEIRGALPSFEPDPWADGTGAAVDIGTTTLAAYLYRLSDGALLSTATAKNPQASFGADVISRMEKSIAGGGGALASAIREGLSGLLCSACESAGVALDEIGCMTITGNTAMLYLLCNENPQSLVAVPFEQDDSFGRMVSPASLELPLRPDAKIYLTRTISAYVGGDITSAALAAGLMGEDGAPAKGNRLLCDIGTNGEMVLLCNGKLLCCSTAAGPAFEGAGLYRGMNARSGAVHRVTLGEEGMVCHVLDGAEAVGLCGSGIVDAIAALLDAGVLDESGYLNEDGHSYEQNIIEVEDSPAFRLPGTQVEVTQRDIRTIQLAKSAICAGMTALLSEAGITADEVDEFLIAGGFGSCIDVASAERIGLILPGFAPKARVLGNAAGTGASMALLSRAMLERGERLAAGAQTIELSTHPVFMEAYVDGMAFPE